ncbi:MAG TPA: hypothetical protein DIW47_02790 [Bacteroidetes bacterium]|nr:hypothetical protein [Bacteroidota bacterium]
MAKKNTRETVVPQPETKSQDKIALVLSALAAFAYYLYSFKSNGYYQHDEIAHLINMYDFWDKPSSILGNWPKTGYKLVYVIPALLGTKFLLILNCLFAGLASFLAYKTAALFDKRYALLAAVLLATQPMWIEISFRNYADSFSGLILIAAVYAHYKEKWLWAGLLLSFSTLVRQEFFLVAIPYGIYLLTQRKWLAAFLMGSFPVLYDIWGAAVTGDPLYLWTSSRETSDLYSEQFARHGFFHFWRMSFVVWGAVTTVLAVLFSSQVIESTIQKNTSSKFAKNPWFLLIPAFIYLLIHSLFNWDALALGASPNLRYMNGIGPVLAVMATVALASWDKFSSKPRLHLIFIAVALICYALFAAYKHNGVVLTEESDYSLLFFAAVAVALLFAKLAINTQVLLYAGLALISGLLPVQPKKPSNEDMAIQNMVKWIVKQNKDDMVLFTNHTVVPYYFDKQAGHLPSNMKSLDSTAIANAPLGSLLVIESHYSLRMDFPAPAQSVRDEFLVDHDFEKAINSVVELNQGNYQIVNQFIAKDQRFGAIVLEKVK